jgi:hypothetical protein
LKALSFHHSLHSFFDRLLVQSFSQSIIPYIYLISFFSTMTLQRTILVAFALLGATVQAAGVSGTAFGFATGTTGGGNATPATPSDISQLTE